MTIETYVKPQIVVAAAGHRSLEPTWCAVLYVAYRSAGGHTLGVSRSELVAIVGARKGGTMEAGYAKFIPTSEVEPLERRPRVAP